MITIKNLTKQRGKRTILSDVNLEAKPGKVTAFLGANGAGKSSTLRILLGIDRETSGTALIGGKPYQAFRQPLQSVGAVLGGSGAHPARTGRAHLTWVAQSNGISKARVDEVLQQVSLISAGNTKVGKYSLGMSQRLGIATALLGQPEILILDEPTNGLDPEGIRWLRNLLRHHSKQGGTVLLSSHLMAEVGETADEVVIISGGKTVAAGSLSEVTGGYGDLERAFFALTAETSVTGEL